MKRLTLLSLFPAFVYGDLDPTGMTQVMNGEDDSAHHVQLGHDFPYLGKVFTDAWMSTNGFVLLWSPTNQNDLGVQTRPTYGHCCDGYNFGAGTPNYLDAKVGQFSYMLAPLWTDLDDTNTRDGDGYYYSTNETESKFLWYKVTEYGRPDSVNTFQLNIDKTGGYEYLYQDVAIDSHQAFIGWTGDTAADPFWHTQQFYGDKFTMNPNATGQLISGYGGDLATNSYSDNTFGLVGQASTLVDCTNPANDSTCDGYWDAIAETSITNQYTDDVFGDEVEDYFFTDNQSRQRQPQTAPPPQPYQNTEQEREMFGLAPRQEDRPMQEPVAIDPLPLEQPEPIEIREPERVQAPAEVTEQPVEVVREPSPEPRPVRTIVREEPVAEPVQREKRVEVARNPEPEKEVEKVVEREVIRPAVDVVGIALSTLGQPTYRSGTVSQPTYRIGTVNSQTQMIFRDQQEFQQVMDVYSVESQTSQVVAQQAQQQEANTITISELAPPTQIKFENDFNDAIATGQSIGQFLSAQLPDFSQFDVAPPSQQEQRTVQRAEAQLQTMSQQDVEQSLENELEELSDTGGFTDQSLAVFLISNNPAFNAYDNVSLTDREFYRSAQLYPSNSVQANPGGILRVTGNQRYSNLVNLQWQR